MSATARVTVKKSKVIDAIRQMEEADRRELLVGFPAGGAARREGEINNATLAYIHEHGSPARNIPARPFLAPGLKRAQSAMVGVLKAAIAAAVRGDRGAVERGLNQAGVIGVDSVQHQIRTGPHAPLKAATIRRKGSSKPLIDTGQMLQSVTYVIRDRRR
jgi:hypothetical protein